MQQKKEAGNQEMITTTIKIPLQLDIDFSHVCKVKRNFKGMTIVKLIEDYVRGAK